MVNKASNRRIKLIPILVGLGVIIGFTRLGFWQLDRADEKAQLFEAFAASKSTLQAAVYQDDTDYPAFTQVEIKAELDIEHILLLDNQIHHGQVGVHVWVPAKIVDTENWMLINYGWVPIARDRRSLPQIKITDQMGLQTLKGMIKNPPQGGIRLGEDTPLTDTWPQLITYLDLDSISAKLSRRFKSQVLLLISDDPEMVFVQQWEPDLMPPEKHKGYAFQWFSMAAAVAIIMLILMVKGKKHE